MIFQPSVCSFHSHVLCVLQFPEKEKNKFKNQYKLRHVFTPFYLTTFRSTALFLSNFPRVAWTLSSLSTHRTKSPSSHTPHPTPPIAPLHTPLALLKPPYAVPLLSTHPTHHNSPHPTPTRLILEPLTDLITSCANGCGWKSVIVDFQISFIVQWFKHSNKIYQQTAYGGRLTAHIFFSDSIIYIPNINSANPMWSFALSFTGISASKPSHLHLVKGSM